MYSLMAPNEIDCIISWGMANPIELLNGAKLTPLDNELLQALSNGVDDVKIFNYALTATQVKQLYTGGALNFSPVTGAP